MRKQKKMLDIEHWVPHDLRRTVRTGLARLGCPQEVGEAALGHSPASIVGVYNLHGYSQEVHLWLGRWNDHLDSLRPAGIKKLRLVS
jgi:integrase